MFTDEDRPVFSFRWMDSHTGPPRVEPPRGELSSGTCSSLGCSPFRSAQGAAESGVRWPRCRTQRRPNAGFPAQSSLLCRRRPAAVSPASDRAGERVERPRGASPASAAKDRKSLLKITSRSSARQVAMVIASALQKAGLKAILSGGGCASIYTAGSYQSGTTVRPWTSPFESPRGTALISRRSRAGANRNAPSLDSRPSWKNWNASGAGHGGHGEDVSATAGGGAGRRRGSR